MPITQVALSNTFNEFRETTNEIITNLNAITDGGGSISTNTIIANTITGGTISGNVISGNTITGVDLTLSGNLTVEGTQTVLNTSTLTVEDKNIVVANGAADAAAANGAGDRPRLPDRPVVTLQINHLGFATRWPLSARAKT